MAGSCFSKGLLESHLLLSVIWVGVFSVPFELGDFVLLVLYLEKAALSFSLMFILSFHVVHENKGETKSTYFSLSNV